MNRLYTSLVAALIFYLPLSALDAGVSINRMCSPTGPYLEIHTYIVGSTVQFDSLETGGIQAAVYLTLIIEKGDSLVKGERLMLSSPVSEDGPIDFIDFRRYKLPSDTYNLIVEIEDVADENNKRAYEVELELPSWPESPSLSDGMLLASVQASNDIQNPLYRHGVLMEPLPFSFYGRGANTLHVYAEAYGLDATEYDRALMLIKIEKLEGSNVIQKAQSFQAIRPAQVAVVLQSMDIGNLPSGNYQVVLELRSPSNELIEIRRIPFQRANPLVDMAAAEEEMADFDLTQEFVGQIDADTLRYAMLAMMPVMNHFEQTTAEIILRDRELRPMRLFVFSYWAKQRPSNPESAFNEYMQVARAVDRTFTAGFRNGFESDRGYTYLKYGQPNDITRVDTDPTAPPYEIWSYDFVQRTGQGNRRFVFYNPTLAAGDFVLLHSDVTGEINNPQWQLELYRDAPDDMPANRLDGTEPADNFNRRAGRIFNDY
ncbi:MAG: GWxTD domain-containing protein [Bacteroidota bacterium]